MNNAIGYFEMVMVRPSVCNSGVHIEQSIAFPTKATAVKDVCPGCKQKLRRCFFFGGMALCTIDRGMR